MKKLALIVLTLCAPALVWAATPGELVASLQWAGTAHDSIFALARRGDELWAATNFGLLLKRNAEPGWKTVLKTEGTAVLGIGFSPQGDGIAVGQSGLMLEAKPNSEKWKTGNSGVKDRLMWAVSNSRGDFLVVGAFGTVLYRPAGTDKWRHVAVPAASGGEESHLYSAIFVSDDEALIVGENETLLDFNKGKVTHMVELGQPKTPAKSPTGAESQVQEVITPSLFTVAYCDGMLVATGQRGLVLTKDLAAEGKNGTAKQPHAKPVHVKAEQNKGLLADWQNSEIEGKPDIYGLACTTSGALLGVSNNGIIVSGKRQAGGIAWRTLTAKGLYAPWLSTALPAGADSFLVAGPGRIWEVSLSNGN